jgi:hypothetical protein
LALSADAAFAADRYFIGPAALQSSASVPQSVVDGVNPQGWVLYTQSFNIKERICELFPAKSVAGNTAVKKSSDLLYGAIVPGAFIGVIHLLPEATEDYSVDTSNQKLRPGYYTMRYAILPAGTYENGTKPGDFVVLSPASMDQHPANILKPEELRKLGTSTSGTDVVARIELVAADATMQKFPVARMDDLAACIFQIQLQLTVPKSSHARQLPLAFNLLTPLHGPEGS